MSNSVPKPDSELNFPHLTVVSASAGSGKTTALTRRYVQFLLSNRIQHRKPRHLLAITFTNNAAAEMKQRILGMLKLIALGDEREIMSASALVDTDPSLLPYLAHQALEEILGNYSEFQVRTIDSFLTNVFRSTAIDLGFSPSVSFELHPEPLLTRTFREFSRRMGERESDVILLRDLVDLADEGRRDRTKFLWDPYSAVSDTLLDLSRHLESVSRKVEIPDLREAGESIRMRILKAAQELRARIDRSGLVPNKLALKDIDFILSGDIGTAAGHTVKTRATNKPKTKSEQDSEASSGAALAESLDRLNGLLAEYVLIESRAHYVPYAQALRMMEGLLLETKRKENIVFLDDVNVSLRTYLRQNIVPELYIKLGDRIHHFLIDEFQDTSPAQWEALRPLLENSLSEGGSLFVVGDMKQSIYSFRGADWRIMRSVMDAQVFASAEPDRQTLDTNYRSEPVLLRAISDVFHTNVMGSDFAAAAESTGLSAYDLKPSRGGNRGHVEFTHIERNRETKPEFRHVADLVRDAYLRGHAWGDIAVLSPANTSIIDLSSVLNSDGVPFVSQSSLDIRNRKLIQEFLALLTFLDSPIDGAAFSSVVLGRILARAEPALPAIAVRDVHLRAAEEKEGGKLYKRFERGFPDVWKRRFEQPLKVVGYLPLYDLVSVLLATFDVLKNFPEEEASLVRFLECVREFESDGRNAVRDFVREAGSGEEGLSWELPRPAGRDAVTLMTIHKAKGLGFPVVIVLLYDWKNKGGKPALLETESGAEILKLVQGWERHELLRQLKAESEMQYRADELNKLYVALTRAKSEMYVTVVTENPAKPPGLFLRPTRSSDQRPKIERLQPMERTTAPTRFADRDSAFPEEQEGVLRDRETLRGERVHEVLSHLTVTGEMDRDLDRAFERAAKQLNEAEQQKLREVIRSFLSEANVANLFENADGRVVWCERDVSDRNGRLFRIDRLIVDPDNITIVDFKTGARKNEEEYRSQVLQYMGICKELYPGRVIRGMLAYVDQRILVDVA